MATIAPAHTREETFYQKFLIGLSALILFGFIQFAARGFVNYSTVPLIFILHGAVMVSWLALMVVQATLVARDNLALHRRLGWFGAVLATVITPLAIATCYSAMGSKLVPPFFTYTYFLALVSIGSATFTATVWAAIAYRRRTEWHRRLMIAAAVVIMEPALGRILPVPLMGGGEVAEWFVMVIQLLTLGLVVLHDRKTLGRIHPATVAGMLIVVLAHVLVAIAALLPITAQLAGQA